MWFRAARSMYELKWVSFMLQMGLQMFYVNGFPLCYKWAYKCFMLMGFLYVAYGFVAQRGTV